MVEQPHSDDLSAEARFAAILSFVVEVSNKFDRSGTVDGIPPSVSQRKLWFSVPIGHPAFKYARIEAAGWLPHSSTPLSSIDNEDDFDVNAYLESYYDNEWPAVKTGSGRIAECDIDEEPKATFSEAIEAHERGLYRCVYRSCFQRWSVLPE